MCVCVCVCVCVRACVHTCMCVFSYNYVISINTIEVEITLPSFMMDDSVAIFKDSSEQLLILLMQCEISALIEQVTKESDNISTLCTSKAE